MLLEALYYFLPAYMANTIPPFLKWVPFLNNPLDFGKNFRGERIFGDHKTIRGFLGGFLFAMLIFYIQKLLYQVSFFQNISIIDYSQQSLLLGFLLGLGVVVGDAVESFLKRRRNIKPGKPWIPFDQLDFVVGAFIFSFFVFIPEIKILITIIIISPILQLIFHYLGYVLKINKDKI